MGCHANSRLTCTQSSSRATTPGSEGGSVVVAPSASPGLGTVRQGRMLRSPRPPGEQVPTRPPGDLTLPPVPQASASPAPEVGKPLCQLLPSTFLCFTCTFYGQPLCVGQMTSWCGNPRVTTSRRRQLSTSITTTPTVRWEETSWNNIWVHILLKMMIIRWISS